MRLMENIKKLILDYTSCNLTNKYKNYFIKCSIITIYKLSLHEKTILVGFTIALIEYKHNNYTHTAKLGG